MRQLVVLAILFNHATAHASVARRTPLPDLVARSDLVVVATAEAHESFWREGRILTRVQLRVEEVWRGRAGDQVEVVTLGGVVGDIGQIVQGAPSLAPGDRVVLFLRARPSGELRVLELSQGVFFVSAERRLARAARGLRLLGPAVPLPQTLAELESRVRELAR